jgi:ribosomal protein L11 methyltransferase
MTSSVTPETTSATFRVGDEMQARQAIDRLEEGLDASECAVAAFEGTGGGWEVALHFAEPPDETAIRDLISLRVGADATATLAFHTVEARDWVKASLDALAPVPAGRFVVHGAHDRGRVPPNKLAIEIEAALAFGTGHHGTTRGCLLLLDEVLRRAKPRSVLDLGAGTGVLAIAAAKALRQGILASDIDLRSTQVARHNAQLNGVGNLVQSIRAKGFAAPPFRARAPFDLVLANILANPLRQLAPAMAAHLAPNALVILSGLLPHQTRSVIAAYAAAGLVLLRRIEIGGWSSLLMQYRR